jgi:dihydroxy-acid dehydratase
MVLTGCVFLVSEIIADSIETVVGAQWYDGLIAIPGCDKNMPGSVMAMGRLNRHRYGYGGNSIHSGKWRRSLNIVSAFEALGKNSTTRLLLRTSRE